MNIRWNKEKKDAADLAREQEKAKDLIGKHWLSFQKELCSKSRRHEEIIQHLYKFRDDVLNEAKYLKENGLEDFTQMSVDIVEQKLALLITARITATNRITQHVPTTEGVRGAMPKNKPFKTKDELLAIGFVQHFTKQDGFTGLAWKQVESHQEIKFLLMATYATGDAWLVGTCVSDFGLSDIPEYVDTPPPVG